MKRIKVKQINNHIWLLNDNDESTGYLVTGSERGLIIDTMTGYGNVRKVAEEITDFPLTVVNTHGHPDHIYGNVYFEKVYIHPADIPVAERFYQDPAFVAAIRQMNRQSAEFLTLTEGDVFDLGGLFLEVYELPGHTHTGRDCAFGQERQNFIFGGQHSGTDMDAAAGVSSHGTVSGISGQNTENAGRI